MANTRPFRALRKLSDEERALALGRIEAGIHPQDVANQFKGHHSTIIRLRDRHQTMGTDQPRSGRPKVTTQHEDRYIAVTVARRRFVDGAMLDSRFCLRKVNGRIREWRRNGERHLEPTVQLTVAYNGGSVMIWAGITLNGRSVLVVVPGNLNGRWYIDEILRPHVVPHLCQMDQNAIFRTTTRGPIVLGLFCLI